MESERRVVENAIAARKQWARHNLQLEGIAIQEFDIRKLESDMDLDVRKHYLEMDTRARNIGIVDRLRGARSDILTATRHSCSEHLALLAAHPSMDTPSERLLVNQNYQRGFGMAETIGILSVDILQNLTPVIRKRTCQQGAIATRTRGARKRLQ
jgi:hypothetical protein